MKKKEKIKLKYWGDVFVFCLVIDLVFILEEKYFNYLLVMSLKLCFK